MRQSTFGIRTAAAIAVMGFSFQAQASLILNTGVTSTLGTTSTGTAGNDLPGRPSTLYFGQLQATQSGVVDFFFVGNEAGYVNSLVLNGSTVHSSAGLPDNFNAPYPLIGSISVAAGAFLDFDLCTSGGDEVSTYGRCVQNDSAASLTAQFNYPPASGYRSIGFAPLASFSTTSSARTYGSNPNGTSDLWMIFWDDSGAKNDDNHDDYIAVSRFRPNPVGVPEPATALLFGASLVGLGLARRRRAI